MGSLRTKAKSVSLPPLSPVVVPISGVDKAPKSVVSNESKVKKNKNKLKRLKWKKRRAKKIYSRKQRKAKKLNEVQKKQIADDNESSEEPISETKKKALAYLRQWKRDRENWKYKKNLQTWLLKHAFDENLVPRKAFSRLILYVQKLCGSARERLITTCEQLISGESGIDQAGDAEGNQEITTDQLTEAGQTTCHRDGSVAIARANTLLECLVNADSNS